MLLWKFAIGFPRRTGCDIAGCGGPLRHTVPPQSQQRAKERSGGISEGDLRRRRRFRIHYRTERGCHVGCRWASFIGRCLHQVQKNALLPASPSSQEAADLMGEVVPTGNQIRAARMMQCFCLTRRTQAGSNFRKRQRSFRRKQKMASASGPFPFFRVV